MSEARETPGRLTYRVPPPAGGRATRRAPDLRTGGRAWHDSRRRPRGRGAANTGHAHRLAAGRVTAGPLTAPDGVVARTGRGAGPVVAVAEATARKETTDGT